MLTAEMHMGNREAIREGSYGRFLYNWFRTYDPATGRYLEADPIGQAGSYNLYSYVTSNSANAIDPAGLTEKAVQYIWRQALQAFRDLHPNGIPICGKVGSEIFAYTSPWSGNIIVPAALCEKPCLTRQEWEDLFFTLFHESMHSSDPMARRLYEGAATRFHIVTSHEISTHHRELYERGRGVVNHIPSPIWGTPRKDILTRAEEAALYEEYRRNTPECCEPEE